MAEHKQCPFCGGKVILIEVYERQEGFAEEAFLQCVQCGFSFHQKWLSAEKLIKRFNKRVPHSDGDFFVIRKPKKQLANMCMEFSDVTLVDNEVNISFNTSFVLDSEAIVDYVAKSENYRAERELFKQIAIAYGWKVINNAD